MNKHKHTPGPWITRRTTGPTGGGNVHWWVESMCELCMYDDKKGEEIARVRTWSSWDEANARLIASAPDLLEALEELMDLQNGPPLAKYEKDWNEVMVKAKAAIAKATAEEEGEQ